MQALVVLPVAEDRGAGIGGVRADALEDAGAVVQAMTQDVDVGVVPRDELTVHPDVVGLLHLGPF